MTLIKEYTAKKLQLWFTGGALLMYLTYMVVSLFSVTSETPIFSDFWNTKLLNRAIMLMPYLVLFGAALLSNKLKKKTRYIPYFLVIMELTLSFLDEIKLLNSYSLGIFKSIGSGNNNLVSTICFCLLVAAFFTTPFAKKTTLIVCSSLITTFYLIAIGSEIYYDIVNYGYGFQPDVLFMFMATILYQSSFIWFAFEMTTDNRIHVYSRIFDYFIGLDYLDDDFSEFVDETSEELMDNEGKQYLNFFDENSDFDTTEKTSRKHWIKWFDDLSLKCFDMIEFDGSDFLLNPLVDTHFAFKLERDGESRLSVSGRFSYFFNKEQFARILKKKSVLNRTFNDIEIQARVDIDISVDSIEEGKLIIFLNKKTFDVSSDDYNAVRQYIIRFLETIIVIHNTESYECTNK